MELAEVQTLMDRLYGEQDRERGVAATMAWLCEELGELAQAVRKGTRQQQVHELGDVLAWLASLANQMGLTLDEAMLRYVEPALSSGRQPVVDQPPAERAAEWLRSDGPEGLPRSGWR